MVRNNSNKGINKRLPMFVVYSSSHPNIKRIANFIASLGQKYFEVLTFEILTNSRKHYILQSLKLLSIIIRKKAVNILIIEPWYPILLVILFHRSKTKLIYYSGNINFDVLRTLKFNVILRSVLKIAEIISITKADLILSDSKSMIDFFSNYNKGKRIYFVPEYIGDVYETFLPECNYTSRKVHALNSIFVIGYISIIHLENLGNRIFPRGWELINICKELLNSGIRFFKFLVVGDGDGLEKLKNTVRKDSLDVYFQFTGFVNDEDKSKLLRSMDIGFCEDYKSFMTHRFNLSSKIQEYLRAGVPVVTGKQGDKEIIIGDSENPCGICIEPLDDKDIKDFKRYISDLSAAITYLKNNSDILTKMSHNCLLQFSELYSKKSIEAKITNIFKEISDFDDLVP